MKAVVITGKNKAEVKEVSMPIPCTDEVVIRVKAAGLCGTDYHIFNGTYPANYPIIPGHEFSGVISAVGSNVKEWSVGQRVTADPNIYCGRCDYCLRNESNMCENMQAVGVTRNGAFAEYVAVPAATVFALSDNMTYDEGAFVEPLSCIVHAMNRFKIRFGDNALISGVGPMGLALVQALLHGGASQIVVCDKSENRLKAAIHMGAHLGYPSIDEVLKSHPKKFRIVIETTGNAQMIGRIFECAGKRAKILQFGCADEDYVTQISPYMLYDNEWEYIGTRALLYTFNESIEMINYKSILPASIINCHIDLCELPDYLAGKRPEDALKVIVNP